jgi:hypothetical protein
LLINWWVAYAALMSIRLECRLVPLAPFTEGLPFLSIDYAWRTPVKQIPFFSYIGAGAAVFFGDNPKDEKNYVACAAVRIPFGFTFYSNKDFTLGFEIAPIYQFLPPYHSGPYGLELNGGLTLMVPF